MFLYNILLSRKVLISITIVSLVSLILTLFPLIGTLGFEYSLVIAFVSSFISIYISAEYINVDLKALYPRRRRFSDLISNCFLLNFTILLFPFSIGLISSLLKSDCYLAEGLIFFALIPAATILFTSSLGLLIGNIFPRRGFFIGSITVLLIIIYSLWVLYADPPIFAYNHIFGFFPGPLYDQVIPIDRNLVIFRIITISWAVFLLLVLKFIHDYRNKDFGLGTIILLMFFGITLFCSIIFSNELGIRHTRDFLIKNYFTDSYETENFIIYFFPGSRVSSNVDLIAFDHEFRFAQLSQFLKIKNRNKVVSYIYPDEAMRKKLIGAGNTTIANPIHSEIHLIYDTFPNPLLKHELTHVLSSEFGSGVLKISPKVGLVEGLAVAADWNEVEGYNPHYWSRAILHLNGTVDLNDITGWGFWAAPASASYTLMGSFVRYLIDTYGIEKFKQVYSTGDFELYGTGLNSLISDWKIFLQRFEISYEMPSITKRIYGRPGIFSDICPRKSSYYSELGIQEFENLNFYHAAKHFEKALSYNPANNYILESLAYSYFQGGNYDFLDRILTNKSNIPDISLNIIKNLEGNAKWIKGDSSEALEIFLELKKAILPLDISNELDIKIDSLRHNNEIAKFIIDYYSTQDDLKRVATLEALTREYPNYPVSYYLLGRLFFYEWDFERSLLYLKKSGELGLPTSNLVVDNERLLGIAQFINGNYDDADKVFRKIIEIKNDGRYYNLSADFLERIKWVTENTEDFK